MARVALEQLTDVLGARHGSRQHRILEGPTVEALARRRPADLAELKALKRIPRFSKNKRTLYGADIVAALQQVSFCTHAIFRADSLDVAWWSCKHCTALRMRNWI